MRPVPPQLAGLRAVHRHLVAVVLSGLVVTALVVGQAMLLARLLAGAAEGGGVTELVVPLAALLAVMCARGVAVYVREVVSLRSAASAKTQLRDRLLDRIDLVRQQRPGEVVTLATRGLDGLDEYLARYLPQLVLAVLVPVSVLVVLVATDGWSALVVATTVPLVPLFMALVGLRTRAQARRQWRLMSRLGGHFLDVVEGLPTLALFRRAKAQATVIRRVCDEHRTVTMATLRTAFLSALVLELLASLSTALVAVEVGLRLLGGGLGYEAALVVLLLTPEAFLALREVGARFHASAEGSAAAEHLLDLLGAAGTRRVETPRRPATRIETAHPPRVVFDAVSLTYPGRQQPALRDVSLVLEPGRRYVLVGPSGAGKSSLIAVLLRFADPTAGRVVVEGQDLSTIDQDRWRQTVSWVPQQPHLFARTVAENIALGEPAADAARVRRAAELAGADEFVRTLPDGYLTLLGERGLRLSAGQRQRLALARAFYRPAPIVVLDEPTAHLDVDNALALQRAVRLLGVGRTVVVVSHSAAVADATVVRLDAGRVEHASAGSVR